MHKPKDYFVQKSKVYENEPARVDNVQNIADAILQKICYTKEHSHILDFGSGTGLLTARIAPYVRKITTVDISASMNEALRQKRDALACELEMLEVDLSRVIIAEKFDGIISSMTIHHVEDVLALFRKFYAMLHEGGSLALADLDKEDGSFHTDDTGVFHFGFEQDAFLSLAKEAGFSSLNIETVSVAKKPYGEYPIFLLTAQKLTCKG